jgi:hypothetical protein
MSKENNNNIEEDKKELKDSESDNSKKTNLSSEDKSLSGNDISSGYHQMQIYLIQKN